MISKWTAGLEAILAAIVAQRGGRQVVSSVTLRQWASTQQWQLFEIQRAVATANARLTAHGAVMDSTTYRCRIVVVVVAVSDSEDLLSTLTNKVEAAEGTGTRITSSAQTLAR